MLILWVAWLRNLMVIGDQNKAAGLWTRLKVQWVIFEYARLSELRTWSLAYPLEMYCTAKSDDIKDRAILPFRVLRKFLLLLKTIGKGQGTAVYYGTRKYPYSN